MKVFGWRRPPERPRAARCVQRWNRLPAGEFDPCTLVWQFWQERLTDWTAIGLVREGEGIRVDGLRWADTGHEHFR